MSVECFMVTQDPDMSEQRDSEARGDDPLTCSKCGGPTKENGRWHPDIGAVYGYELGLAERDPAPDTPEVAERPEKCPTCGGAPDDPGYDEINAGDQTGRDYCPDPFHTPEDTSRVEEDEPIDLTTPVRTRARLAAWREVEGDISGYDSEGYQRMIDHWPVVDDPERLGEVDEGESQEHEGTRVAQAVIAEIDKAYARGYNDGVQAEEQPQPVASEEDRTRVGAIVEDQSLLTLDDADTLTRVLTDSEALAQYAKERGE